MHYELIESLVSDAVGTAARVQSCEQIRYEERKDRFRAVYRVAVKSGASRPFTAYAKVGNDFQVRKESALFQHVLQPNLTATPALLSCREEDGILALLLEEISGTPFDPDMVGHLQATVESIARLHENCRPNLPKVVEVLKPGPPPQAMFEELRGQVALWSHVGLTDRDLEPFYFPSVVELIGKDPPTLVHGDLSKANVFVAPDGQHATFIDFGMAMVQPSTAEFMYFPDPVVTEGKLDLALRHYSDSVADGLSLSERRICQRYWHGSYYADCLAAELTGWTEMDVARRSTVQGFLDQVRSAGVGISQLVSECA